MELGLTVLMLAAVVAIVGMPLRRGRRRAAATERPEVAATEAAIDAKYREILETELDLRTGKLAEPDYREIDQALRAEAATLARRLDEERARR